MQMSLQTLMAVLADGIEAAGIRDVRTGYTRPSGYLHGLIDVFNGLRNGERLELVGNLDDFVTQPKGYDLPSRVKVVVDAVDLAPLIGGAACEDFDDPQVGERFADEFGRTGMTSLLERPRVNGVAVVRDAYYMNERGDIVQARFDAMNGWHYLRPGHNERFKAFSCLRGRVNIVAQLVVECKGG